MQKRPLSGRVTALALLASGTMVAFTFAPAAHAADDLTYCSGAIEDETIPGDLEVRAGDSCELTDVTIEGELLAGEESRVLARSSTFKNGMTVESGSQVQGNRAFVSGGELTGRGGMIALHESSEVWASFVSEQPDGDELTVYELSKSQHMGGIRIDRGSVHLFDSNVSGNVTAADGGQVTVDGSKVVKDFTVADMTWGAVICDSEVYGDVRVEGSEGGDVQLGGFSEWNSCGESTNHFDKDVTISNNNAPITVYHNIIVGTLSGDGNEYEPEGSLNLVRGGQEGQFADLEP
ncbi:hypothetical protein [Aeromicrobium sp. CTD01-1L150]|uniref:hypothetical protein n=1 Tax=Aeromicrobium sp. CTD01-1L150 TaxID=3341830 RepID=UPI0035BF8AC4